MLAFHTNSLIANSTLKKNNVLLYINLLIDSPDHQKSQLFLYLNQGSQTQLTWGLPKVEPGSGLAASNIAQKKRAQLTQSKLKIGL